MAESDSLYIKDTCMVTCMICSSTQTYFFVNLAQYHSLCYTCALSIQSTSQECKTCNSTVKINFLQIIPTLRPCANHSQSVGYNKCKNKLHYFCDICATDKCNLCIIKCKICNIEIEGKSMCNVQHNICKNCYSTSKNTCPICTCISCGFFSANNKRSCNHYNCDNCFKLDNCNQCIKTCVFCQAQGKHNAKKCKFHFMCFSCFGNLKYKFSFCIFCEDKEKQYTCYGCKLINCNLKSVCKLDTHKLCPECCNTILKKKNNENKEISLTSSNRSSNICTECYPLIDPELDNKNSDFVCEFCKIKVGKLQSLPCCKHFYCGKCISNNNCPLCSFNCRKCGIVYDVTTADCSHKSCTNCLIKYDCESNHSVCDDCYKSNAFCFKCSKKCDICKENSSEIYECDCSVNFCSNCSGIQKDCKNHYNCKKCSSPYCKICNINFCFNCEKMVKELKLQNCDKCHELCSVCNSNKCKLCEKISKAFCIKCNNLAKDKSHNKNCKHIECKKCSDENFKKYTKGRKCAMCEPYVKPDLNKIECLHCFKTFKKSDSKCKTHKFCPDCWKNIFKKTCPVCHFLNPKISQIIQETSCKYCNKITDIQNFPCEIHQGCQKCVKSNRCECYQICISCDTKKICKKLSCNHFACNECKINESSDCKLCYNKLLNDRNSSKNLHQKSKSIHNEVKNQIIKCAACQITEECNQSCNLPDHQLCKSCSSVIGEDSCGFCSNKISIQNCSICFKHKFSIIYQNNQFCCFSCCMMQSSSKSLSYKSNSKIVKDTYVETENVADRIGNNNQCISCHYSGSMTRLICGHYECGDCFDMYKMCALCRDKCNICYSQPVQASIMNEKEDFYGVCLDCKGKYSCVDCRKIWALNENKKCLMCCKDEFNRNRILLKCLKCKSFDNYSDGCCHLCVSCKSLEPCIYCNKSFSQYFCQVCKKLSPYSDQVILVNKICAECSSNHLCHFCQKISSDSLIFEKCNQVLCQGCFKYFKMLDFCPFCHGFDKNQCFRCKNAASYSYLCKECFCEMSNSVVSENPKTEKKKKNDKRRKSSPRYNVKTQIVCSVCNLDKSIPELKYIPSTNYRSKTRSTCIECLKLVKCNKCSNFCSNSHIDAIHMICTKCIKALNHISKN